MAIISTNQSSAEVCAMGTAREATVNFSGALMDMLSTTYSFLLMAAIREAVQNGCDAVRKQGLSFSEGVFVQLPTPEDPMLRVVDRGAGMSAEFMDSTYLSFGSSTKSGDDGAAGGLGVGRWAAYGYSHEAYITTCHADDRQTRTYFQFQGPEGKPQVQLAAVVPDGEVGTKVEFPVKETDFQEAYRAVAWLRDIMQLTMGDTFSVDAPSLLPEVLPEHSGTILDLGTADPSLEGVRVHAFQGAALKYGRRGVDSGSLVVMVNREEGVGGLPFHVSPNVPDMAASVFERGMLVEIPMRFRVPFMPSREEVKYTDDMLALMARIDRAAVSVAAARIRQLYMDPSLDSQRLLARFIGEPAAYAHAYTGFVNGVATAEPGPTFKHALGGKAWSSQLELRIPFAARHGIKLKSVSEMQVLRDAVTIGGTLSIVEPGRSTHVPVTFTASNPVLLVANDVKTGGVQRFRAWLARRRETMTVKEKSRQRIVFIEADSSSGVTALELAQQISDVWGGELEIRLVSSMPEIARVVGAKTVSVRGSRTAPRLAVYNVSRRKQDGLVTTFDDTSSGLQPRYWLQKDGAELSGFSVPLPDLTPNWGEGLATIMRNLKAEHLFLLTASQVKTLRTQVAQASESDLWDAHEDEVSHDPELYDQWRSVQGLKRWRPLEQGLASLLDKDAVQKTLSGELPFIVRSDYGLTVMLRALTSKPRLGLAGTRIDAALRPYVDVVLGEVHIDRYDPSNYREHAGLCEALRLIGSGMAEGPDDSDERKALIRTLTVDLVAQGTRNFQAEMAELCEKFPLLGLITWRQADGVDMDHAIQALACMYR